MRIYNGTNSVLDLPLTGIQRLSIPPHAVSGDFMPTNEFLGLLVTSFDYSELAIIVSGPYEISMCAGVSGSVGFVVQTLEEAIERFTVKTETKEEVIVPTEEVVVKPVEVAVEVKVEKTCEKTNECSCVSFSDAETKETEEVAVEDIQPEEKKSVVKKAKKSK